MKYNIHTLENGLRVILAPMAGTETATVIVMTGTGSRYENEEENGLAHFLEHMFFKGTKKRPSAKAISEQLDGVGAVYNAYTSKDRTAYFAKVSARYLDTALDVISDIFLNSALPEKEIKKEQGAVIQEIGMYEDMPMRNIGDVFDALIFGTENSLGRTVLGPKENIQKFTRKDFAAYLKRNYVPSNTVVCVAGSFAEAKIFLKIKKTFGHLKHGVAPEYTGYSWNQHEPRVAIKEKQTDQTQLMLGVPAYPYLHPDEFPLTVLSAILGAGMSSRLFTEVREKRGLAYSVHSWVDKYPDVGYFVVQAGVDHDKLKKALETILDEFKKIKRTKVSSSELSKAKAYIKGTKTLSVETSDEIAGNAATSLLTFGKIRTLEDYIKGIEKVTPTDVQRVAQDIFRSEHLNLAVIGPHSGSDTLRLVLKI